MPRLLDLPRLAAPTLAPPSPAATPLRIAAGAVPLAGIPVRNTRSDRLVRFLHRRLRRDRKIAVGFVNQNFVLNCRNFGRAAGRDNSLILVNDGVGVQIAALLRFGRGFKENLNGTDFVPRFLRESDRPLTVFLIGSEAAIVNRAAAVIEAMPQCRVVGRCDGFSLWNREAAVLDEIAATTPDVLLVGLGNPVQERWVLQHWDRLDTGIVFCVGALFEWISGHRKRAPALIRYLRMEWLYRLALEPRRLFRRYTVGILWFFALTVARPATAGLWRKVAP